MANYYYPAGMVPNEKPSMYGGGMPPGAGLYTQPGAMGAGGPAGGMPGYPQQLSSGTTPGYPPGAGSPYGSGLGLAGASPYAGAGLYQPAGGVAMPQPGLVTSQAQASIGNNPYLTRATQPTAYPGGLPMATTMSSSLYGYPTYSSAGMPQQAGMPSQGIPRVPAGYPGPQMHPQLSTYPGMGPMPGGPPLGPSVAYPYGRQQLP